MEIIRIIRNAGDIVIPKGMTRNIKYLVMHCTAGPQHQTTQEIFNYWMKNNGWKTVGYHYDINPDGEIEQLLGIDKISNGVAGYNSNSIHICYKGGIDKAGKPIDNRTEAQKASQWMLIQRFKQLFPNIIILGHRDFSRDLNGNGIIDSWEWIKSCPAFDVRDWIALNVGKPAVIVPSKIVYKVNNPLIRNETVKEIQRALGFKGADIDGYYGNDTDKAVRVFQAKYKLKIDGQVGPETAKLLGVKI